MSVGMGERTGRHTIAAFSDLVVLVGHSLTRGTGSLEKPPPHARAVAFLFLAGHVSPVHVPDGLPAFSDCNLGLVNLLGACVVVGLGFRVHCHGAQIDDRQRRRCLEAIATNMSRWIEPNVLSVVISGLCLFNLTGSPYTERGFVILDNRRLLFFSCLCS